MTMQSHVDELVRDWAQEQLDKLDETTKKHISWAKSDLYHGPIPDGWADDDDEGNAEYIYPGFCEACKLISKALDDIPREIFIDIEFDEILEREPEAETRTYYKVKSYLDEDDDVPSVEYDEEFDTYEDAKDFAKDNIPKPLVYDIEDHEEVIEPNECYKIDNTYPYIVGKELAPYL